MIETRAANLAAVSSAEEILILGCIPCVSDSSDTRWPFSDAVRVAVEDSPSVEAGDSPVARTFAAVEAVKAVHDTDLDDLVAASPSLDLAEARVKVVGQSASRCHRQ